jgi:putative DNA primase/helicase
MIEGTGKRLSVFPIPISTMTLVSQRQLQRPLAPVVTLHSETTTVGEGSRNASLTSLAGTLRRKGLGFEEIYGTLLEVNQKRCDPPLDQREVEGIANYSSTEKFPFNDYGNSERFVALHGIDVRYAPYLGYWFLWTGTHWEATHFDRMIVKAIEVTSAMALEVTEVGDEAAV